MKSADSLVALLIAVLIALYAGAFVLSVIRRTRFSFVLFAAGFALNAGIVVLNWVFCGHPPFGNMYHVQVLLGMCFFPLYGLMARRFGLSWVLPYFAFAAFLPLIGTFFLERDLLWQRVPALQSPWFIPHVVSYMISYSLALVAFVITVTGGYRQWRRKPVDPAQFSDAGYQILRLAFPFMTFGMLSGALWADDAWGVYWSWDPKETWSLITWMLYVTFFHCRMHPGLKRYAAPVHIAAFAALLVTFFLVNLLPKLSSALHSYA